MKMHDFKIVLAGAGELTEDDANGLFDAGCDDCLPGDCEGVAVCRFHREAASLEEALRSAIADIRNAGFEPQRVEIDGDDLQELLGNVVATMC